MEFEKILNASCISVSRHFSDKKAVLKSIAELAKNSPVLENVSQEKIYQSLLEREELSSTGFGKGIAIPHCALEIEDFVFGVLTIEDGVEFEAIDEKPVNIVLFMLAPKTKRNLHIRYLSALSNMLNNELNRKKILSATSPEAVKGIFLRHTEFETSKPDSSHWSLFNIIVQEENILDEALTLLAGITDTSITVLDALSASHYLYSKPLFSSLWGPSDAEYCKMIIATVPGNRTNEVIRSFEDLLKNYSEGLQISVQELSYLSGMLNI